MGSARWFEKSYRRNLVDMHIEAWDESFLSRLDPDVYVEMLKTANVQSAMVYANSHIGYCYWPTKNGEMHPGLRGRDVFGDITSLCHTQGMDVIAYYTLIFNNWAYDHDPSWRILYEVGMPSREIPPLGRYGVVCPNNSGYRAFVEAQVEEILNAYPLEGIFFDMTFWPGVCYCAACRARYAREVGGEMPATIDWQDPKWIAFQKKREEWLLDFASFATSKAKRLQPEITVEHNSAPLTQPWFVGTTLGLREYNDYIGGDLYGGFAEQSFVCKLYRSISRGRPFEFMTSRCYPSLRDHTTLKSKDMLEVHTFLAMAHNGAFFFIDAIDPVGRQNHKVYERMGDIFRRSQAYEPYLGGEMCQDVAVYFSLDAKMDLDDNGKPANLGSRRMPHLDAALGAAKTLKEKHIPFGVISKNNLRDAGRYSVIILPDVLVLGEDEAQALTRFVENGGALYASGQTDLTHLSDLFGIETEGLTTETVTYITPAFQGARWLPDIDPAFPLSIIGATTSLGGSAEGGGVGNGRQVKARAKNPDNVVATLTLPYTDPSDTKKMASIHSNPPGIGTDYASIVYRRHGKGHVIWVAAPMEAADQEPHKSVFAHITRTLANGPLSFEVDAPPAVEITLFHQPEKKRYIASLINEQELLPPVPACNVAVRVRVDGHRVTRALLLPDESPLPFEAKGDYVEVMVSELRIFQMLALEYE
jgi:hypothetical protein